MITYYLPSSLFVVVSWASFLIPSDDIQVGKTPLIFILFRSSTLYSSRQCLIFFHFAKFTFQGRMALLITLFLVLVNIFNAITTNSPKADGLNALQAWVIACIFFIFGKNSFFFLILLQGAQVYTHNHNPGPKMINKETSKKIVCL